jgi:hypothetical protein
MSFSAHLDAASGGAVVEETKPGGQRMRPKIYLFGANPFAVAGRLGTERQSRKGENRHGQS